MKSTKEAIIKAYGQLLDEKPMNKITVKDIVERCGINRNTFYYHFQDIPALFEQMMEEKTDQLLQNHFQADQPLECIRPMLQYGIDHKRAVLHVYRAIPRETFLAYLTHMVRHFVEEYVANAIEGRSVPDETAAIIVHCYRCSMVGLLLDWLDSDMQYDVLALSQKIYDLFGGVGESALFQKSAE